MKLIFLISLIFLGGLSFAQSSPLPLNEALFESQINNKSWSLEDTTQKADYEMFFALFFNDTISIAYINWIESMAAQFSIYELEVDQNIAIIKPLQWKDPLAEEDNEEALTDGAEYIYCYLKSEQTISVLFADKKFSPPSLALKEPDWPDLQFDGSTEE